MLIIFSRDRPIQLSWCLTSIKKYLPLRHIIVQFSTSSLFLKKEYEILSERHKDIEFKNEKNFKFTLLHILSTSKSKRVMFLTDDCVFIDRPILTDRYGGVVGVRELISDRLKQNPSIPDDNNYLFSVDGRVYSTLLIKSLLFSIPFYSPSTLESRVNRIFRSLYFIGFRFYLSGQEKRCLLNFELNRVSQEAKSNTSMNLDLYELGCNLRTELSIKGVATKFHNTPNVIYAADENILTLTII